jgi:hypothetical protein
VKRIVILVVVAVLILSVAPAFAGPGNGAPSGPHYNLNIIGKANPKDGPPMDDTGRHVIFVPLQGNCNIGLKEGSFSVLDGNCFDGDGAQFQLPNPDPSETGTFVYTVWVRVKQKSGSATMKTCIEDAAGTWCSTGITLNKLNYNKFTNVSKDLLRVCVDTDPTAGVSWNYKPLFWDPAADYWWEYDNNGLKLAQFRFYPVPDDSPYTGSCTR